MLALYITPLFGGAWPMCWTLRFCKQSYDSPQHMRSLSAYTALVVWWPSVITLYKIIFNFTVDEYEMILLLRIFMVITKPYHIKMYMNIFTWYVTDIYSPIFIIRIHNDIMSYNEMYVSNNYQYFNQKLNKKFIYLSILVNTTNRILCIHEYNGV